MERHTDATDAAVERDTATTAGDVELPRQNATSMIDRMKLIDRKMRVSNLPKAEYFSNVGIYVEPANGTFDRLINILTMIHELKGAKLRPARTVVQTVTMCTAPHDSQTYSVWARRPYSESATSVATLIIVPDNTYQQWIDYTIFANLKYFAVDVVSKRVSNVHAQITPRSGGFSEFDVVICKASQYTMFSHMVDEVWSRLVIDEIDSIRFTGGKIPYTAARFVWVTSSSSSYKSIKTGSVPRGFIKDLFDQRMFWKNIKPFICCTSLSPVVSQTPSPAAVDSN